MKKNSSIAILLMALAIAGCNRSSNALNINTPPQPLPSVPSGTVQSSQLDPISNDLSNPAQPGQPGTLPQDPALAGQTTPQSPTVGGTVDPAPNTVETASLGQPEPAGKPLTHELLQGTWKVASDSSDCRVFLAFTKWSGGYRAGTKRCLSAEIATVSAWDVKGTQVVLVGRDGNQVATLYSSGDDRYDGKTATGVPISFTR